MNAPNPRISVKSGGSAVLFDFVFDLVLDFIFDPVVGFVFG
jgi:hypothetical protein